MTADAAADGDLAARFTAAETRLTVRDVEAKEIDRRTRREALNRLQQLLVRVEPLASRDDLSVKAAERALADVRAARGRHAAAPFQAGLRRWRAPLEGGSGRAHAEAPGASRDRRLAALGQCRHPGAALREDGGAEGGRGSRRDRAPDPRAPAAVASGRRRAARAGRGALAALQGGSRRGLDPLRSTLCRRGRTAPGKPGPEDRVVRARRGARRLDELGADGGRDQAPAGRVEDDRAGLTRPGKTDLGTLPRRLRSILHPPPRRSRTAKGVVGREPREERGAVREGRGARRIDRLGRGSGRAPAPPGRVEGDRPGQEEPVRGDLAALPRRVRSLFPALRAAPRDCP